MWAESKQLFDTQFGWTCALLRASDGTTRCLPFGGGTLFQRYSDAACTQQLVSVSTAVCNDPKFVGVNESVACPATGTSQTRIHSVGAVYTGTIYQLTTQCKPMSAESVAGYRHYPIGAEMPPEMFVSFSAVLDKQ